MYGTIHNIVFHFYLICMHLHCMLQLLGKSISLPVIVRIILHVWHVFGIDY